MKYRYNASYVTEAAFPNIRNVTAQKSRVTATKIGRYITVEASYILPFPCYSQTDKISGLAR